MKRILQKILGTENYIYFISRFKIITAKITDKEIDDFYYFLKILQSDFNVIDIGANAGIMTLLFARKLTHGHVYSFEPVPFTFNVLRRITQHYKLKNISLFQLALGDECKIINISVPLYNNVVSPSSSFVSDEVTHHDKIFKLEVNQVSLDSLEEFKEIGIQAIKLDVENYEYHVLKGAKNLILRNKPIIYSELWNGFENQINTFKLLTEWGYTICVYDNGKLIIYDPEIHNKANYFFIPKEKIDLY